MTTIFCQAMNKTECKKLAAWWNANDKKNLYFIRKAGRKLYVVIQQTTNR